MRCREKLCRRCCLTVHCKMHRNCCECRQGEVEKMEYKIGGWGKPKPAPRDCVRHYYNGIECKKRDQATGLVMDLHRLGHPIDDSQETDDCQPTDGCQETKETKKQLLNCCVNSAVWGWRSLNVFTQFQDGHLKRKRSSR